MSRWSMPVGDRPPVRSPGMLDAAVIGVLALAACAAPGPTQEATTMRLTSSAFDEGGSIPTRHTCDGEDLSPPLAWDETPDGTAGFVLLVTDPDAGDFVHWLLTDIPGDARELGEGTGDAVGMPGRNDLGRTGWGGPCPPSGEHRYVFTLYALSEPIQLDTDGGVDAVREAVGPRTIAEATLTGVYQRSR